jgi:hypothetical protein
MDRIALIRRSLATFVLGIFSLVPLVGFFTGLFALFCWVRLRRQHAAQWNPAAGYLKAGAVMAGFGVALSVLVVATTGVILILRMVE